MPLTGICPWALKVKTNTANKKAADETLERIRWNICGKLSHKPARGSNHLSLIGHIPVTRKIDAAFRHATSVLPASCIFNFIFLVWRQPAGKMRPPWRLQASRRRPSRERGILAGLTALRPAARSAGAGCSKLEPLLEHEGLQPSGLVFLQV